MFPLYNNANLHTYDCFITLLYMFTETFIFAWQNTYVNKKIEILNWAGAYVYTGRYIKRQLKMSFPCITRKDG